MIFWTTIFAIVLKFSPLLALAIIYFLSIMKFWYQKLCKIKKVLYFPSLKLSEFYLDFFKNPPHFINESSGFFVIHHVHDENFFFLHTKHLIMIQQIWKTIMIIAIIDNKVHCYCFFYHVGQKVSLKSGENHLK